jgi:hypothetical protein
VVGGAGPGVVAARARWPVLVQQAPQDGVGGVQMRERRRRVEAQACPSTAPGTPVFVEYFGWIFVSGRMWCTAWATAIAASA